MCRVPFTPAIITIIVVLVVYYDGGRSKAFVIATFRIITICYDTSSKGKATPSTKGVILCYGCIATSTAATKTSTTPTQYYEHNSRRRDLCGLFAPDDGSTKFVCFRRTSGAAEEGPLEEDTRSHDYNGHKRQ